VPLGKRQRKLLLGSGLIIVAFFVIWLALPYGFLAASPLAAAEGAHYATYTRERVFAFQTHGSQLTNHTVRFSADTLSGLVPSSWLWRLASGGNSGPEAIYCHQRLQFVSIPSGAPSSPVYADARDACPSSSA